MSEFRAGDPSAARDPRRSAQRPVRRPPLDGRLTGSMPVTVVSLVGFAATWVFFILTPLGRRLDSLSYHGRLGQPHKVRALDLILLHTITVSSVVLGLLVLVLVAGVRGQWRVGLRTTSAVLGALATVEVLKHLLPAEDDVTGGLRWPASGSFPSGHTVIVTSISLAVLSVSSPAWRRRLVGPLVAWTAVATTATVTVGWHRPSDVLGSFFLAIAWHCGLGVGRPSAEALRRLTAPAIVWWSAACLLVLGAAFRGVTSGQVIKHTGPHAAAAYVLGLVGLLAGAAVTIMAGGAERVPSAGTGTGPVPVDAQERRQYARTDGSTPA